MVHAAGVGSYQSHGQMCQIWFLGFSRYVSYTDTNATRFNQKERGPAEVDNMGDILFVRSSSSGGYIIAGNLADIANYIELVIYAMNP